MPVLSLGVLYLFAVLPIAVVYGLGLAIVVSVASMLAFNWFHLPPVHTFTLADSENWFALAVYLATAVVVSELAARARRRAAAAEQRERESALLAELATELLRGRDLEEEIGEIGVAHRRAFSVRRAPRSSSGSRTGRRPAPRRSRSRSTEGWSARCIHPRAPTRASPCSTGSCRRSPRCSPSRPTATRLERDALEAEALRRSDLVKTALLRAVSHDLRSPLTGITHGDRSAAQPDAHAERRGP